MSAPLIGWRTGDASLHRRVERALALAVRDPHPIHTSARRTLYRLDLEPIAGGSRAFESAVVVCKLFHRRRGLKALRETLKLAVDQSAAQREWNALGRASSLGLPVPTPLAYGRISSRDEVLVMSFEPGRPLLEVLPSLVARGASQDWLAICAALAEAIDALHAAGLRHGDLHAGNLRLAAPSEGLAVDVDTPPRVVLLDFQRARPLRGQSDRLADLAQLEFSLSRSGASEKMCQALRQATGVGTELDRAILLFLRDYRRGRARRQLRVGRDWERITAYPDARGVMLSSVDFGLVHECYFSIDRDDPREVGVREIRRTERVEVHEMEAWDRRVVTKRVRARSPLHALVDRVRGSAGARAFRRGRADRLISDRAAPALAFIDVRRSGLPVESWLLMDRVGDEDLDHFRPKDEDDALRVAVALGRWVADQHVRGLSHRDLKAGNIRLARRAESIRFWLVDLQDLTGPGFVPEFARIEALAQLNASLADEAFDLASRRAALAAYGERLGFGRPIETVAQEVARKSLARRHRWRGEGCEA